MIVKAITDTTTSVPDRQDQAPDEIAQHAERFPQAGRQRRPLAGDRRETTAERQRQCGDDYRRSVLGEMCSKRHALVGSVAESDGLIERSLDAGLANRSETATKHIPQCVSQRIVAAKCRRMRRICLDSPIAIRALATAMRDKIIDDPGRWCVVMPSGNGEGLARRPIRRSKRDRFRDEMPPESRSGRNE